MASTAVKRAGYCCSALALGLITMASSAQLASSATMQSLSFSGVVPNSPEIWPVLVSMDDGFFAHKGFRIGISYGFEGTQLLASGKVDILQDAADGPLTAIVQGKRNVLFLADTLTYPSISILVRQNIQSIRDLQGKAFGVTGIPSTDMYLISRYLQDHGVNPATVKFTSIASKSAALAEVAAGQLAGETGDTVIDAEALSRGGFRVLAATRDFGSYPWGTITTTRAYAATHRAAVITFLEGYAAGLRFLSDPAHQGASLRYIEEANQTTKPRILATIYRSVYSHVASNYSFGRLTVGDIRPALNYLTATKQYTAGAVHAIKLQKYIDNSYIAAALKDLKK